MLCIRLLKAKNRPRKWMFGLWYLRIRNAETMHQNFKDPSYGYGAIHENIPKFSRVMRGKMGPG